jgi:hypothetical protein
VLGATALAPKSSHTGGVGPQDPKPITHTQGTPFANTDEPRKKIILIPLDSRPAAGQFAQMIGAISDVEVIIPPYEYLGRFTNAGKVDKIFDWLESQKLDDVSSLVVSADMLAYGGLIASRVNEVDSDVAIARLKRLVEFRKKAPEHLKTYVFAATMRLTPTATEKAGKFRLNLAKYEELKDRYERTGDPTLPPKMSNLRKVVPSVEILRYERTRSRNHEVQKALVRMCIGPQINFLIMGQDDAKPDGPQIQENARLRVFTKKLDLESKIYFCEGIDQHANLLISRAILEERGWKPRIRVVYSDEQGRDQFAMYESKTVEESLNDQIFTSGAQMVREGEEYDYTLYLNTPKRSASSFSYFVQQMKDEVDQGFPVAVADINFTPDGASDDQLLNALFENRRAHKLLSFAGWNTAGNTMGTAIPSANVYLSARKFEVNPLGRELAQKDFLLHRMADDYAYHKFTRPATYRLIDNLQKQRDEVYGSNFETIDNFARVDLRKWVDKLYIEQFKDKTFFAGTKEFRISGLSNLKVFLPWPRAYEVRIEFNMKAEDAEPAK